MNMYVYIRSLCIYGKYTRMKPPFTIQFSACLYACHKDPTEPEALAGL